MQCYDTSKALNSLMLDLNLSLQGVLGNYTTTTLSRRGSIVSFKLIFFLK